MGKKILLIGIDPVLVKTYSPERGLSPKTISEEAEATNQRLSALGYLPVRRLLDPNGSEAPVIEALSEDRYDCIMIGAGLRGLPENTLLFEKVMNAISRHGASAVLCFNSRPGDTVEAVLRGLGGDT